MSSDGFTREPDTIRKAMVMTTSRLTAATQERDKALVAAAKADNDVLLYERQIERCRDAINGLLDEWNAALEKMAGEMVDAG